ncbi:hypothetical protein [Marinobacter sp. C2H3]|uniref:hypothetical protein n=1 Tax=Marinobacter sp. C2H3 TaxID=3119003 RepID=UPI00300E8011
MKQFLLAAFLIAVPVVAFSTAEIAQHTESPSASAANNTMHRSLGDLSEYESIVEETRNLAAQGDLKAAEKRVTRFETLWDDEEDTLRPQAPNAWGNVDAAADKTFAALRAAHPDEAKALAALDHLSETLKSPDQAIGGATVKTIAGTPVTDANGHPVPCETLLGKLRSQLDTTTLSGSELQQTKDLQAQATERCNADDDVRSDQFAAQALALIPTGH